MFDIYKECDDWKLFFKNTCLEKKNIIMKLKHKKNFIKQKKNSNGFTSYFTTSILVYRGEFTLATVHSWFVFHIFV